MIHLDSVSINPEAFPVTDLYPFNLPLFKNGVTFRFNSPVTFLTGENGSGKSTVLKAMARRCGIHIWEGLERRRVQKSPLEKDLYRCMKAAWREGSVPGSFFDSELFNNYARNIDEWADTSPRILELYGNRAMLSQSHGQGHMAYFTHRYSIPGLYLLDEPENALSPRRQIELIRVFRKEGFTGPAQFVICTHSPILLACPGAEIYRLGEESLDTVPYRETEHYRLYRDFLSEPEKFLEE